MDYVDRMRNCFPGQKKFTKCDRIALFFHQVKAAMPQLKSWCLSQYLAAHWI